MATQHQSRPTATDELVRRLRSGTDLKELEALNALTKEMIKIFRDEHLPSHVSEAAALAPAITGSSYQDLSRAFGNAVIRGTADGNIPERQLLEAYMSVLRYSDKNNTDRLGLGNVMKSLHTRLTDAGDQSNPTDQYRLILALSSVLGGLIDRKVVGLSRENLHEPLLKQLGNLSRNPELRLAQAACYAHQALLGIPNDEGPYRELLRKLGPVAEGVVKLVSAVSTMDPAKLLEGLTQLAAVPDLVRSMVEVVKALSDLVSSLGDAAEAVKLHQKQNSWYVALRFTDMLLYAGAFHHLKELVRDVPCRDEKEFLCGLYAQLERAWVTADPEPQQQIVGLFDQVLAPMGCESRHRRVHEWVKLVAGTLGQLHWNEQVPPEPRFLWPWETKYTPQEPYEEPNKDALSTDLLNEAWKRCLEAQVFYADAKVREHYLENDERLLQVERLSRDRLPMEQCYINLAVVEQAHHNAGVSEQADSERKSSPFSLPARLKVEAPAQDKQVSLHSLFDARKRQDGTAAPPQRILIRGQAGVGKTTLCKRIVYNYLRGGDWAGLFDRLFWVPLRTLKTRLANNPAYNLEHWLRDEYFRAGDGDIFAKALAQTVDDPRQRSRTLFLLDGLDEVFRELDSETPGFLHNLLKQVHVIVTSRPAGPSLTRIGRIDLELETIGFNQDQVKSYIKMAARQQAARQQAARQQAARQQAARQQAADQQAADQQAAEIEAFLQDHSLLQGLVRIPIQLDALCYSWDASMNSQAAPTTMTALYQQIGSKLWKKDVARLEKSHEGKPLSEDTAKRMRDKEITSQVKRERALLQCLAFAGLCSDVIEFDQNDQDKIWEHWPPEDLPSSLSLAKVSFLRSSDEHSQNPQSYHFLHLTFQEFFAAQYFVEHWNSGKKLDVPRLGRSSLEIEPTAEGFLRKEKYKARYDVFWRFVAGLFYEKGDEGGLCRFFHTIDDEPRDLLGPTHQRLVMHCLNEVPSNNSTSFADLRTGLERQLSRWVLFECRFRNQSSLANEMELPEQVLEDAIRQGSEDAIIKILSALRKISARTIQQLPNWLKDGVSTSLQIAALKIPQPLKGLPLTTLEAIIGRLQDENGYVRRAAVQALAGQAEKPEVFEALIGRLQDRDEDVRRAAVEALASQAEQPKVFEALIDRLQDGYWDIRWTAVGALVSQAEKPEAFKALIGRLQDENEYIRQDAVEVLAGQAEKPEVFKALIGRLQDENGDIRRAAVEALAGHAGLTLLRDPGSFYKALLEMSFDDHLSWYVDDEICIDMPGRFIIFPFNQIDQFRDAIRRARETLGIPEP
ncbi:hypothetical protein RB595_004851 [Gaeumannomyces hyphopodioides]